MRPSKKKWHSRQHAFECSFHGTQPNLHGGVFPQQNVVLEINTGGTQFQVQRRDQLTFDVIRDAAERFVLGNRGQ
jgi:hypothetical protein